MRASLPARLLAAALAALVVVPVVPAAPARAADQPATITLSSPTGQVSAGLANVTWGDPFTIVATVDPDGAAEPDVVDDGSVRFAGGPGGDVIVPVLNGMASHTWLLLGGASIQATYEGGSAYTAPPSPLYALAVLPVPVAVAWTPTPASPVFAGTTSLDVTVDPTTATDAGWTRASIPAGGVRVYRVPASGPEVLIGEFVTSAGTSTVALNLPAGVPVPAGTNDIRVEYLGGLVTPPGGTVMVGFAPGSATGTLTVAQAPATVGLAGPTSFDATATPTFTVTVGPAAAAWPPTGIVRIHDGPPATGPVVGAWLLDAGDAGVAPVTLAAPLAAGAHSLYAHFEGATPSAEDPNRLDGTSVPLAVVVAQATPVVTWPDPAPITYGTALSATELDATADVPGTFDYTPPAGTVLHAGQDQVLSVTFTPVDTATYETVVATARLDVGRKTLTVTPDARTRAYVAPDPAFTFSYAGGFVGSDSAADIDTPPTCSSTAIPASPVGSYPITCAGGVDADYAFAFGPAAALTITKADQAITFISAAPSAAVVGGPAYTPAATATSGLPVALAIDPTSAAVCTIAAGVVSFVGAGTCRVNADQAGDGNWNAATRVQQPFEVGRGATATTIGSSPDPSTYGAPVTFLVTVSPAAATGTVTIADAGTTLGTCTLSGGTCTYATSALDAGTHAITAAYGGDASYAGSASAPISQDVDPKALTVTGITASPKVYDGTTAAAISTAGAGLSGVVPGDTVTLVTTGATGTFADKDVGTGKAVQVAGLTLGGADAGNYTLTQPTTTANITPLALTVTAAGVDREYDGTTVASVTITSAQLVVGDAVVFTYTATFQPNGRVGTAKTVNVTGIGKTGADAGNYTLANTTATTTASITPRLLAMTVTPANRTYDGTTAATATGSLDRVVAGDHVNAQVGTASFADKNVGTGKAVTATGLTIGGPDASQYTLTNTTASGTADIAPRSITAGATGINKVYDGTAAATVTITDNRVAGDVVTYTSSASFLTPAVGTGKTVNVTSIAILGGADAGNYTLANTSTTTTASITAAGVTPSIVAADKVYDATTTATAPCSLAGVLAADVGNVTCAGTATFGDKNVGSGKTVTATGIALGGTAAGNYALAATTAIDTADISQRPLTVTATGVDRVYDGTAAATVTFATDKVGADVVTVSAASATFADENVGAAKPVTVTGIAIGGADAGNYALTGTTAAATASITRRPLIVTATAQPRVYDRTTAATVTLADDRIAGDDLTVSHGAATFADKNVGTGKLVTVPGISLGGTGAGNYTAAPTVTTTGTITARSLVVTATASDKVYDGTTAATVTLADNRIAGDVLSVTSASATFASENAGAGKTVTVTGIAVGGTDAGNYTANTSTTATASITPRALAVTATAAGKVYDGTTAATVTLADNRVAGDILAISHDPATFDTRNVGTGKVVTVPGIVVAGTDAGNYTFNTSTTTTANITRATVGPVVTVSNRTYDATTAAAISGRSLTGVIGGDAVTLTGGSAAFPSRHVGPATVTVTGLSLAGTDAGNYQLSSTTATTSATITVRLITVTAVTATKVYDGTTSSSGVPTITSGSLAGSETATWTQAFATKTAGTGKVLTPAGAVADGNGGANYGVTFVPATGSITQKAVTVTGITAAGKVYDGTTAATLATGGGALVGQVPGDSVALDDAGAVGTFGTKDVGTGKVVTVSGLTLTGGDALNYALVQPTTTAAITKATLTVTTDPKRRPYGAANPALTVTYGGFVPGETLPSSGVTGAPTCATAATPVDPVGPYPIDCAAGTLAAANYAFTVVDGILTIDPAPLTLTAGDGTRQYGLPNPAPTWSVSGFVLGQTQALLVGAPACATSTPEDADVGTYAGAVACTPGTLGAPNYAVTTILQGALTVSPAIAAPVVTSSANPAAASAEVTLTATVAWRVGTPTGTVTFFEGSTDLSGPVPIVAGAAQVAITWPLAAGDEDPHDVVAVYSGDGANFGEAAAAPFRQVVGRSGVDVVVTADRATWEATVPITFTAAVAPQASGVTVPVAGLVTFRVDGAVRGTAAVAGGAAALTTTLGLGGHAVVAEFAPADDVLAVLKPASSAPLVRTVVANTVSASGIGVSSTSIYPVRDTWKDTVAIRGTRNEAASVAISIYRVVSGPDPRVRTATVARAAGPYAWTWNGRTASGTLLSAGTYRVVQVLTDAWGAKRTVTSSVTLSRRTMRWFTRTIPVSAGPRNFSVAGDASIQSQFSTTRSGPLTLDNPVAGQLKWLAVGYQFTLPAASTYESVSLQVQGSWTDGVDPVTAPKIGLVPWSGGDWFAGMYSRTRARTALGASPTTWYGQKLTNLTGIRSGRSIRAVVDSFEGPSGYAAGPFRYSITGVRLVVRYGILE